MWITNVNLDKLTKYSTLLTTLPLTSSQIVEFAITKFVDARPNALWRTNCYIGEISSALQTSGTFDEFDIKLIG